MFCPNCGAKLTDDSVFCSECGSRLTDIPSPDNTGNLSKPEIFSNEYNRINNNKRPAPDLRIIIPVIVGSIVLVVAVAAVILLLKKGRGAGEDLQDDNGSIEEFDESDASEGFDETDVEEFDETDVTEDFDDTDVTEESDDFFDTDDLEDPDNSTEQDTTDEGASGNEGSKAIAAKLSTDDNAMALEFDWFYDKVFDVSKGEWANVTDLEYSDRITDSDLLNGGWKCYIKSSDQNDSTERYLHADIDTDGGNFKISLRWWGLNTGEWIEETGTDVCTGKWDAKKGTVHTVGNIGNVDFSDFYLSKDKDAEYAVGTLQWNSGELDYVGLMRETEEKSSEHTAAGDMIDQVEELVEKAKKKSGAPEAEIDWNQDGTLVIHLFETVDDGGGQSHQSTWDWYTVDPNTGKGTDFLDNEIDLSN